MRRLILAVLLFVSVFSVLQLSSRGSIIPPGYVWNENDTRGRSYTRVRLGFNQFPRYGNGYGGEIVPSIADKRISDLTPDERFMLYEAQKTREGSTVTNNPFGMKLGAATRHWVDDGLAVVGNEARDGGRFLRFKSERIAEMAYQELLYESGAYSDLTVDEAMQKWSGAP